MPAPDDTRPFAGNVTHRLDVECASELLVLTAAPRRSYEADGDEDEAEPPAT